MRYGMRPTNLCSHCDGCKAGFTVEHALSCKKGGLVCVRHDDVRDEAGALAAMALTNSKVSYEPQICYGRGVAVGQESEARIEDQSAAGDKVRGNMKVRGM